MIKDINMFVKITCDKCGFSQTELEPESNDKFFNAGWGFQSNAKKYFHLCGKCLGKRQPIKTWEAIKKIREESNSSQH